MHPIGLCGHSRQGLHWVGLGMGGMGPASILVSKHTQSLYRYERCWKEARLPMQSACLGSGIKVVWGVWGYTVSSHAHHIHPQACWAWPWMRPGPLHTPSPCMHTCNLHTTRSPHLHVTCCTALHCPATPRSVCQGPARAHPPVGARGAAQEAGHGGAGGGGCVGWLRVWKCL